MDDNGLPLPAARCLSKEQAAAYLGIGVTLLTELGIPHVKFGRRCVYDVLDLDSWLEEYKRRECWRAGMKGKTWLVKQDSTEGQIQGTGGLIQRSQTANAYAKALGLKSRKTPKPY